MKHEDTARTAVLPASAKSRKRAAIYLRISLDQTGEELAVERQREDALQIAGERGWTVTDFYIDNSISASKVNVVRPEYNRLVEDYGAGLFDVIICYDLDRFTRLPRQLEDWIDEAEQRGLVIVTMNGEADLGTDAGRLFARIKAAVAKAETERKAERQRRANRQRADRGKVPAGVRLTGYAVDGVVIETEAAIVREMYERFAAGETLKGLAGRLNEAGIPTRRGGQWHSSSVRTMLTNPRYAGRAVYRGEPTGKAGEWVGVVSEGLFDVVQARLTDPRRITNRVGTDRKHLGSGMFLCGACRRPVRTNSHRYWCPAGGHVIRSMRRIDDLVLGAVAARLARPDLAGLLARATGDASTAIDAEARELRRLEAIEADYDDGHIDGRRFAVASEKVQAELRRLELQRAKRLAGGAVGALLSTDDPAGAFASAPLAPQRAVIDALVEVTLLAAPQGSRVFDPASVLLRWKADE